MSDEDFKNKYLKYKTKYLNLNSILNMTGGGNKVEIILAKAEWCGHCKHFKPTWERIAKEFNTKFIFTTLDSEKDKTAIEGYGVDGFPTILFKDGDIVKPYEGGRDYEELKSILNALKPLN
jgi:thiol-disulfide isomerase/thioredoxin